MNEQMATLPKNPTIQWPAFINDRFSLDYSQCPSESFLSSKKEPNLYFEKSFVFKDIPIANLYIKMPLHESS